MSIAGSSIAWTAMMVGVSVGAADLPAWTGRIRPDHPRLFFNAETWPAVKQRALREEQAWYQGILDEVDRELKRDPTPETARDAGPLAARAAFVYRVTGERKYLDLATVLLRQSVGLYEVRFAERKAVDWYSITRIHAVLAWDWLYEDLDAGMRADLMGRLLRVVWDVIDARPHVYRENYSGHTTGFYGVHNALWFLGCTGLGTDIEPELATKALLWGYNENRKMLEYRRNACGDDGGSASPTLGYAFGAYPWTEQNFLYTWLSSTGEDLAGQWPHSVLLGNYVLWNWIPHRDGPLEFGYGDAQHTGNRLPSGNLYTHMANIRHLAGEENRDAAGLAAYVQTILPEWEKRYDRTWFVYPFLLTRADDPVPNIASTRMPHARHFEQMGQVFLRSGTGLEDTYCLFSCGGTLAQHRHYDALNFVIYRSGFQALDSGTRHRQFDNGLHLANYYAQTVAHNCVLIQQPDEPVANYWGGDNLLHYGGQRRQLGSTVEAFETNDDFVYVAGDATACYRVESEKGPPPKAEWVSRQIVFLMPGHFVIFDRVRATAAEYRKDWLLHTAHEPVIRGRVARSEQDGGCLFLRTLWPEDAILTKVGGPGHEFRTGERNWELNDEGLYEDQLDTIGRWRLEVTPATPRREDVFLHVIQVGDRMLAEMDAVEPVKGEGTIGCRIRSGDVVWTVAFAPDGPLAGQIRREGGAAVPIDRPLAQSVEPQAGIVTCTGPERGTPLQFAGQITGKLQHRGQPKAAGMSLERARDRIPQRTLPGFWVGSPEAMSRVLEGIRRGTVEELAATPGGRRLVSVSYGPAPALQRANFNSAVGGRDASAYADRKSREHPVVLFVGPVHGHETEGLTGLCSLIQILETGKDLAGREQAELADLAGKCRVVIVPVGNPDGLARFEPQSLHNMTRTDLRFWGQGTR
ncbi:MAG: heparinase II/III family protein, partial [Lentisphaeria bacterium]|nr:heparinase II/III family protein [Lentisphaeria bacterium]